MNRIYWSKYNDPDDWKPLGEMQTGRISLEELAIAYGMRREKARIVTLELELDNLGCA